MEQKQNSHEQEYAAQRAKWQEEVQEMRHEEEQKYFKVEKSQGFDFSLKLYRYLRGQGLQIERDVNNNRITITIL